MIHTLRKQITILSAIGFVLLAANMPYAQQAEPGQDEQAIRHIFVARRGPGIGGIPFNSDLYYASSDGFVQYSHERSDDVVLDLWEGELDTTSYFADLGKITLPAVPTSQGAGPGPLSQRIPEVLFVEIAYHDDSTLVWQGAPDALPAVLEPIHAQMIRWSQMLEPVALEVGDRFARSQILPQVVINALNEAGAIVQIAPEVLDELPQLAQVLAQDWRLIVLTDDAGLYGDFALTFRHGHPVHVSVNTHTYQIRHLISEDIP